MRKQQIHDTARKYLRLSNAVIEKLRKEYKFVLIGRHGYDAFVFWGSSNGNNAWRDEKNEIPFGAPVYLIAKDHAKNTPVYCCIQYSPTLISISRLSGTYNQDGHPSSASCIVTVQNQVLMNTKTLLGLPSVAKVLDFNLPINGADAFVGVFNHGAKGNFQQGIVMDSYIDQPTKDICKDLSMAKYQILYIQSTETSSEIYFTKDTNPHTQVLVVKTTYCNDGQLLISAGFASIDPVLQGWQSVRPQFVIRDWPYTEKMPVAKYCDAVVITNSNLRLLKKINVGDMIRIVKENMPDRSSPDFFAQFEIVKSGKKSGKEKPLFHSNFFQTQLTGAWNHLVISVKTRKLRRLKNKMCSRCCHSVSGNTLEIFI